MSIFFHFSVIEFFKSHFTQFWTNNWTKRSFFTFQHNVLNSCMLCDTLVLIFFKLIILMTDLPQYPLRFVCRVPRQIFIMLCTWQMCSNAHSAYVLWANVFHFLTFHYFFTGPLLSHSVQHSLRAYEVWCFWKVYRAPVYAFFCVCILLFWL